MKKNLLYGIVVCFLLVGVGVYAFANDSYADAFSNKVEINTKDACSRVGNFIKNNDELNKYVISMDLINFSTYAASNIDENDVLAYVNEISVTVQEFDYRCGTQKTFMANDVDYNEIFNKLVEEKMVLNFAYQNNVLPSEMQINDFITLHKEYYNTVPDFKIAVDSITKAANISLDDYWENGFRYDVTRMLIMKNAADYCINKAKQENLLANKYRIDKEYGISFEEEANLTEYWRSHELLLKQAADVVVNADLLKNRLEDVELYVVNDRIFL